MDPTSPEPKSLVELAKATNRLSDVEFSKKFVVALNEKYEIGRLLSAIGHVTASLTASQLAAGQDLSFVTYVSKDEIELPSISDYNFMALKGKPNHLKRLREDLVNQGFPAVIYTDTMLDGGSTAQQEATAQRAFEELEILALATFGDRTEIDPLTKRFSLWRP